MATPNVAPEPHADVEVEPVRSAADHDHRADGPRSHLRQQRADAELDGIAAVRHERVEDRRERGHAAERPALLLPVDPGAQAAQGEGRVHRLAVVLLRQRGDVRLGLRPVELHAELDVRAWRGCERVVDGRLDERGRAELVGRRENRVARHEQRERLRERGVHGVEGVVAGQAADRDAADRHAVGDVAGSVVVPVVVVPVDAAIPAETPLAATRPSTNSSAKPTPLFTRRSLAPDRRRSRRPRRARPCAAPGRVSRQSRRERARRGRGSARPRRG